MTESELHIMALVAMQDDAFRGAPSRSLDQIKAELRAEEAAKVVSQ